VVYRGVHRPGSALPADIVLSSKVLNLGKVRVGGSVSAAIHVKNNGFGDTLRISELRIDPPFSCSSSVPILIPSQTTMDLLVKYRPTAAAMDSSILLIPSNDADRPIDTVRVYGSGISETASPIVLSIKDIPNDQGHQVRIVWLRSMYDGIDNAQKVTDYHIWRKVGSTPADMELNQSGSAVGGGSTVITLRGVLWDFIQTIPTVGFEEYSHVVPTLIDSGQSRGMEMSEFSVSARTSAGGLYFSEPDIGYSVDNLLPHQPMSLTAIASGGSIRLNWDAPSDPDIWQYEIYRGTEWAFIPSEDRKIGISSTNSFTEGAPPEGSVYYCITAVDLSGNRSGYSDKAGLFVTDVKPGEDQLPDRFSLYPNYPNPFNPSTQIRYDVPSRAHVVIRIYDTLGREVATLVDEEKPTGRYSATWSAGARSSGVYWFSMTAGRFHRTERKLLLE
jgi:hypothetical protein